jgi:Kdo2-lipid IVA lauroyltransferase/acyltransferase
MPRTRSHPIRHRAEYWAMRAAEVALRLVPLEWARLFGRAVGRMSCVFDRRHRSVAEANVAWALGLGPAEARRFVRRVYSNFGATSVEVALLPHILRRRKFGDFFRAEGTEHLRAALERGKGAIVITAHLGNWEFSGLALAQVAGSVLSVARPLDNPLLDAYVRRARENLGQQIVDREGALKPIVRHLRQNGVVGILIDQNQHSGGVFVDFFGRLASTVPTPAYLALKYDVPVLAGYSYRPGRGFAHVGHIDPPFELIRTGDLEADVAVNTALFTRRIESYVREHPDQWFWLHSRWRKRPPAERDAEQAARPAEAAGQPS